MPTITSDPSTTDSGTLTGTTWWIKDPTDATRNLIITVDAPTETQRTEEQSLAQPLGREHPVVIAGVVRAHEASLECDIFTDAEYDAIRLLLDSQRTLLLQATYGEQWYIRGRETLSITRKKGEGVEWRAITFDWVEVEAP